MVQNAQSATLNLLNEDNSYVKIVFSFMVFLLFAFHKLTSKIDVFKPSPYLPK